MTPHETIPRSLLLMAAADLIRTLDLADDVPLDRVSRVELDHQGVRIEWLPDPIPDADSDDDACEGLWVPVVDDQ